MYILPALFGNQGSSSISIHQQSVLIDNFMKNKRLLQIELFEGGGVFISLLRIGYEWGGAH